MDAQHRITVISVIYFSVAALLVLCESLKTPYYIAIVKPLLLPILAILYIKSSKIPNPWYLTALLLGVVSNVLVLFSDPMSFFYGITTFLIYRIMIIGLVIRYTTKFHLLAFVIAIVPFLFAFCYLIDMTQTSLSTGVYPAIANALVMSVLAALSLSNYVFVDDRRNSWLLISALLFVVLMFLFVIERFYLENPVFKPLSVIIFSTAHYAFYKYLILSENEIPTAAGSEING